MKPGELDMVRQTTSLAAADASHQENRLPLADSAKQTVIVLGTVGHGKSLFLNRLAGEDVFKSKNSVYSVT